MTAPSSSRAARPAGRKATLLALSLASLSLVPGLAAWAPPAARGIGELPFGWYASLSAGDGTPPVETHAAAAAFALDAGRSIHPSIAPGTPWRARYEGVLSLQESGRYRFAVEAEGGAAEVRIASAGDGERELDRFAAAAVGGSRAAEGAWLDLGADDLRVTVAFRRSGEGRARLRLLQEMDFADRKGFTRAPVIARFVSVPEERAAAVARGLDERAGFVLLERKRCAACHPAEGVDVPPAPDLSGVGSRAPGAWIARWMADPARLRPGADMPAVLSEPSLGSSIASYLVALREDELAPIPERPGRAERGRALYHSIGCAACHGALASPAAIRGDDYLSDEVPDAGPFPLGSMERKWNAPALAAFLADPARVHPDGRMPSLLLTDEERFDLAVYLTEAWGAGETYDVVPPTDRARKAFVAARCNACHATGEDLPPAPAETPLARLDPSRGCLDPGDAASPRYDLTEVEREQLVLALASLAAAPAAHPAPLERAERRLELAGCNACHARGGAGGPAEELRDYFASRDEVDLGDEGRIPPDLTGVGFRLTTSWLREILEGTRRSRPYMATRMPLFDARVTDDLAEDLARLEGAWPDTDAHGPEVTDALVAAGRGVMGRDALGCVACHVYRDYPPSGSPGLDVTGFGERLRYEWCRSFLQDPARYEPGTRMPAFGRGGVSTLKRVAGGDMLEQIDAMWAYFSLGDAMLPPEGLEPSRELQIEVGERPVVLRTFLEGAGSRAIAVGNPSGVHLAYDAARCVTAQVWRGEFLDAAGAWAGRGGTPAGGRGETVWELGGESQPALEGRDEGARFRGYRLDDAGVPTFRFTLGDVAVEETHATRAAPRAAVGRLLVVENGAGETLLLPAGPHEELVRAQGGSCERVEGPPGEEGSAVWRVVPDAARMELLLEVSP